MIKCVKRGDLDVKKWNHCIQQAHNSRVYSMSYYLDSVCAKGTWLGLIYNDYEAVMALPINQRIPLFPRIMLPHFAQQLGVFSKSIINSELMSQFLDAIPSHYKSVYLQLNEHNQVTSQTNKEVKDRSNYVLSLHQDHDTLFSNYSANLRKNIRKAAKLNFTVDRLSSEAFIPFYLMHDKSKYLSKSRTLDVLGELLPTLLSENVATIYCAKDEDQNIMAACVITAFNKRLTYMMANSSAAGRSQRAMHWLLDQIIMEHCTTMDYFDFEGSDIPSIAEFFAFFGAELTTYQLVKYDRFPFTLMS